MGLISDIIESNRKRDEAIAKINMNKEKAIAKIEAKRKKAFAEMDAANAEMEAAFNDPNMSSDELISLFKKNMKRIDAAAAL